MTALPSYIAGNQRMGSALLGSMLFHAAVVALVSLYLSLPTVGTSSGFLVTAATAAAVAGVLPVAGRRL